MVKWFHKTFMVLQRTISQCVNRYAVWMQLLEMKLNLFVCSSISEEEPGPLRSDTEGKSVTKVSRTFSYLKNKMYKKTRVREHGVFLLLTTLHCSLLLTVHSVGNHLQCFLTSVSPLSSEQLMPNHSFQVFTHIWILSFLFCWSLTSFSLTAGLL